MTKDDLLGYAALVGAVLFVVVVAGSSLAFWIWLIARRCDCGG